LLTKYLPAVGLAVERSVPGGNLAVVWLEHQTDEYTIADLAELFSVSRPTVYRTISRTNPQAISPLNSTGSRLRDLSCDRRAALSSSRQVRQEESRRATYWSGCLG
jgi:transposase